jgi:hypothetical protein
MSFFVGKPGATVSKILEICRSCQPPEEGNDEVSENANGAEVAD